MTHFSLDPFPGPSVVVLLTIVPFRRKSFPILKDLPKEDIIAQQVVFRAIGQRTKMVKRWGDLQDNMIVMLPHSVPTCVLS